MKFTITIDTPTRMECSIAECPAIPECVSTGQDGSGGTSRNVQERHQALS